MKQSCRPLVVEFQAGRVVSELYVRPTDRFSSVIFLLKLEDVLVEVKMKCFICVVDTELLKTVSSEILKAKNVKNTNRTRLQ